MTEHKFKIDQGCLFHPKKSRSRRAGGRPLGPRDPVARPEEACVTRDD